MPPRAYTEKDSVDFMWDDLVYTHSRLLASPATKPLAAKLAPLVKESEEELPKEQRAVWRGETEAQSGVDGINLRADDRTDELHADLLHANRKHPQGLVRQERYFPIPKSKIIELGLASQIRYIEDFANSLPSEPEPDLQAHGQGFAQDLTEGRAALSALASAAAKRRDFRVKRLAEFRDRANKTRTEVYGDLLHLAVAEGRGREWAESYFRKRRQNTPEERQREELQDAIFANCKLFGLELDEEQKKRILKETDPEVLLRWLRRAASARTAEEIFG